MAFHKVPFTTLQFKRFREILALFGDNMKSVLKKTSSQMEKIAPLESHELHAVQGESLLRTESSTTDYQEVSKSIIRLREFFAHAVFVKNPFGESEHFAFVLAMQRPFRLLLMPLERIEAPVVRAAKCWSDWARVVPAERTYRWRHAAQRCVVEDVFAETSAEYLGVLNNVFYVSADHLETRDEMISMTSCLHALVGEAKSMPATVSGGTRQKHPQPEGIDVVRPWMKQLGQVVEK
eukprot:6472834-Amphidinium_carterae.6